jgi:hypothetical protein
MAHSSPGWSRGFQIAGLKCCMNWENGKNNITEEVIVDFL